MVTHILSRWRGSTCFKPLSELVACFGVHKQQVKNYSTPSSAVVKIWGPPNSKIPPHPCSTKNLEIHPSMSAVWVPSWFWLQRLSTKVYATNYSPIPYKNPLNNRAFCQQLLVVVVNNGCWWTPSSLAPLEFALLALPRSSPRIAPEAPGNLVCPTAMLCQPRTSRFSQRSLIFDFIFNFELITKVQHKQLAFVVDCPVPSHMETSASTIFSTWLQEFKSKIMNIAILDTLDGQNPVNQVVNIPAIV